MLPSLCNATIISSRADVIVISKVYYINPQSWGKIYSNTIMMYIISILTMFYKNKKTLHFTHTKILKQRVHYHR